MPENIGTIFMIEVVTPVVLVLTVLIVLAIGWFILPFGLRQLAEIRLARLCKAHKVIVLSYDDGPGPALTQRLLGVLEGHGLATFFVLGRSVAENGDTVAQVIGAGHEVGSHSFHHSNAWKVGPVRAARDLAAGIDVVRGLGGNGTLYRPPYGKLTLATLIDSQLRHQRLGWWTIDTKDTKDSGARRQTGDILDEIARRGGGVVLMHDFDKPADPDDSMSHADYVISLTEQIIEFAEKNGYRLMRLGDVLQMAKSGMQNGSQDRVQGGVQG